MNAYAAEVERKGRGPYAEQHMYERISVPSTNLAPTGQLANCNTKHAKERKMRQ
jgi:hypothetical protein